MTGAVELHVVTTESLFEIVSRAMEIAGSPVWHSPEGGGELEALLFLPAAGEEQAGWGLVPIVGEGPSGVVASGECDRDEVVPVDVGHARSMIADHLRGWLAARGWQVQMMMLRGKTTWRLADCLAVSEGGGDRLDDHYPSGEDELGVLCASVEVLARHGMG